MRVLGLAFGVVIAVTVSVAAQGVGLRSNMGPASAGLAPGVVGGRRLGRTLGGSWRPNSSWSYSPMERSVGAAALGAEPFLWLVGSLWRAGRPDLLGLRPRERSLRLPLLRLARPDGRVG